MGNFVGQLIRHERSCELAFQACRCGSGAVLWQWVGCPRWLLLLVRPKYSTVGTDRARIQLAGASGSCNLVFVVNPLVFCCFCAA